MKKKSLLLSIFLFTCLYINAQQKPQKQYTIDINNQVQYSKKSAMALLKLVTVADSVILSKTIKDRYLIYTKKELNQNIIEGKLQKNATPMSDFQYIGESSSDLLK